ncbi:MAG TPA: hypothetical protein VKE74_18630, partial [Gemmataceae bacterium]|nr:hypothetical protein [Gemmataceae bacterium]
AGVAWSIGLWTWQESPPLRATPPTTPATALLADPVPPEELALPVPQNEEKDKVIRRIYLSVGNGWWLDLSSDGTTRLGYGAADTWLVKPKTFDFAATLKALRAVARKEGLAGGRHYLVAFHAQGEERPIQGYTQDGELVLGLFDKAIEALEHRNERFEQIWKEQPPFKIEGK